MSIPEGEMQVLKNLMMALVSLIAVGCATTSVDTDFAPAVDKNEGVIVLSISTDKEPGSQAANAMFYLNGPAFSQNFKLLQSRESLLNVPAMAFKKSEFEDVYGRILVFPLPAGTHRLTTWQVDTGSGMIIQPARDPEPYSFDLRAGEVRYLGNLHASLKTGKNVFGFMTTGDAFPEIRDERARDVGLFESRYPKMAGKVVVDPLPPGPWLQTGGTTQGEAPRPVQQ